MATQFSSVLRLTVSGHKSGWRGWGGQESLFYSLSFLEEPGFIISIILKIKPNGLLTSRRFLLPILSPSFFPLCLLSLPSCLPCLLPFLTSHLSHLIRCWYSKFEGTPFYGAHMGIPETSSPQADKHTPLALEKV